MRTLHFFVGKRSHLIECRTFCSYQRPLACAAYNMNAYAAAMRRARWGSKGEESDPPPYVVNLHLPLHTCLVCHRMSHRLSSHRLTIQKIARILQALLET